MRKQYLTFWIATTMVIVAVTLSCIAPVRTQPPLDMMRIVYHGTLETPSSIETLEGRIIPLTVAPADPSNPASVAEAFFKSYKSLYNLKNPKDELKIKAIKKDAGPYKNLSMTHIRIQQNYKNLRIFGAEAILHLSKDLQVVSVSGSTVETPDIPTEARIDRQTALEIAIENIPDRIVSERRGGPYPSKDPELGIFVEALFTDEEASPVLAYRIETLGYVTYVDAITGNVLIQYDNVKTLRDRQTYTANNTSRLPGTLILPESSLNGPTIIPFLGGTQIPTESCADTDSDACNAHRFAGQTYDYYSNTHGRDSYDGGGATILSTVHYFASNWCPNAGWTGSQMMYCDGLSIANDVVAHEITHAVTDKTADLDYLNQSGAINESYSDVFGAMVDRDDWSMGEDLPSNLTRNCGAFRSLSNPPACGSPDHLDKYVLPDDPPCKGTLDENNGCVHINSGIPNKAAWLIANGGSHFDISVKGISKEKMEHIYYRTLSTRLTSTSNFADLRRETEMACNSLVGKFGINYYDCKQVRLSFMAVGITPSVIIGERSEHTLSLAYFKNKFYIAWTGTDSEHHLNVMSSSEGITWANKVTLNETSDHAPTLTTDGTQLYLGWTGTDSRHRLNIIQSTNGQNWTNKFTLSDTSIAAPALTFFNARIYLAWTGTDSEHHLNVISSSDGVNWGNKKTFRNAPNTAKSDDGPSLLVENYRLYLTWGGRGSRHRIFWMSTADGANWTARQAISQTESTEHTPSLAYFKNKFYIAWTGTDSEHHLNVMSSSDGVNWGNKRTFRHNPSRARSDGGPYLLAGNDTLRMTWSGRGAQRRLQWMTIRERESKLESWLIPVVKYILE